MVDMNATKHSSHSSKPLPSPPDDRYPWTPGFLARLPIFGISALGGALCCAIASSWIIYKSNDDLVDSWPLQPQVWLAVTSALSDIFLKFAFAEGIIVCWWKRASRGSTVKDLHQTWDFGHSVWASLLAGRKFNIVALACIIVTLVPLNGPLTQNASTVTLRDRRTTTSIRLHAATEFPEGYEGFQGSATPQPPMLLPVNISTVMQGYTNRNKMSMPKTDCVGECTSSMRGIGIVPQCTTFEIPYQLQPVRGPNGRFNFSESANDTNIFVSNVDVEPVEGNDTVVTFKALFAYKDQPECSGSLKALGCLMELAVMEYPVLLTNDSIVLHPNSTIDGDKRVADMPRPNTGVIGGIAVAFANRFQSTATLVPVGSASSHVLDVNGPLAADFVSSVTGRYGCSMTFKDPSAVVLAGMREILFRISIHASLDLEERGNSSFVQTVPASQVAVVNVYRSHYLFLGLALALNLVGLVLIVPTYWGWWAFGRKITLSPIEIARAFRAPGLASADGNAPVKKLLREIGDRPVRYGELNAVAEGAAAREAAAMDQDLSFSTLQMAEPEHVSSPRVGEVYH